MSIGNTYVLDLPQLVSAMSSRPSLQNVPNNNLPPSISLGVDQNQTWVWSMALEGLDQNPLLFDT